MRVRAAFVDVPIHRILAAPPHLPMPAHGEIGATQEPREVQSRRQA